MNAQRFVSVDGHYVLKIHCGRCHKVEVINQHVFTASERKHHPWVLGEDADCPPLVRSQVLHPPL